MPGLHPSSDERAMFLIRLLLSRMKSHPSRVWVAFLVHTGENFVFACIKIHFWDWNTWDQLNKLLSYSLWVIKIVSVSFLVLFTDVISILFMWFSIIWKIMTINTVRGSTDVSKGSVEYPAWRFFTSEKCTLEIYFGIFFAKSHSTESFVFYLAEL